MRKKESRAFARPWFRLLAFDFDDLPPGVVPAIWAYVMGKMFFTAVDAVHQMPGRERVVRSTTAATAFGNFPFWKRGHGILLHHSNA
jgi:hypothetical protein